MNRLNLLSRIGVRLEGILLPLPGGAALGADLPSASLGDLLTPLIEVVRYAGLDEDVAGKLAFSESANPLAWAIMGDYFGRRSYATLRGWQHLPDQMMSMSTPVWMGWIFDHNESGYFWALIPLAVIYGLASACYLIIPRPRPPARLRRRRSGQA